MKHRKKSTALHPLSKSKKNKSSTQTSKLNKNVAVLTMESECTHYQIKAGWMDGAYIARAFLKQPTTPRGIIAEASGTTQEKAIDALNKIIQDRNTSWIKRRRIDPETGMTIPTTEEYADAIHQAVLALPQSSMLLALAQAGDEGLSEIKLAQAAGYKSISYATRSMEKIAFILAACLSASNERNLNTLGGNESCTILGTCRISDAEKLTETWVLHSELREAVLNNRDTNIL